MTSNPLVNTVKGFIMQELTNPEVRAYGQAFLDMRNYLAGIYKILVCRFGQPPDDALFRDMVANNQVGQTQAGQGIPWVFDLPAVTTATTYDVVARLGKHATRGFVVNSSEKVLTLRYYDPVIDRETDTIRLIPSEQLFFDNLRIGRITIAPATAGDSVSIKGWLS